MFHLNIAFIRQIGTLKGVQNGEVIMEFRTK